MEITKTHQYHPGADRPRMTAEAKYGEPAVVMDKDDDVWVRTTHGTYSLVEVGDGVFEDWQLDALDARYGPLRLPTWPGIPA